MGKSSREYFEKKGYSVITKYNYRPDKAISSYSGAYNLCDEETVDDCDFVYSIHDGKTGFYKAHIMDAVRGRCNALITMSPDNMDFIREIKDTFGEYVVSVYMYIDKSSLEEITRSTVATEYEVEKRVEKGAELRRMYLDNMSLFDKTVIFSTDNEFGLEALYEQYDIIINQAEKTQKRLNDQMYVELPYTGNQDYVFVSYSHKDEQRVLPYLSALQREGFRIWYDEGINKSANWNVMLGERLQGCTNFLLFSSANSVASKRVEDEVNGAKMCDNIHPITVRLDDAKFPFGYEMYICKYQIIFAGDGNCVAEITSALNPSTKAG